MPSPVPAALAPYLQECIFNTSQTLITSVLNTPAHWLVTRIITAAVHGRRDDSDHGHASSNGTRNDKSKVIFLSLVRPWELWAELGKRIGLDLQGLVSAREMVYIDGLDSRPSGQPSTPGWVSIRSCALSDLEASIHDAKHYLLPDNTARSSILLVIDGLDFVLASQPHTSALQVSQMLATLREEFDSSVLTAMADGPLIHHTGSSALTLEVEHSIFVRTAAYQSTWLLQLRPLDTGHAKDVSGVIRISRGGMTDNSAVSTLSDSEWLYQVKSDGHVRMWLRGG